MTLGRCASSATPPTRLLQMRSETERVVVVDLASPSQADEAGIAPVGILALALSICIPSLRVQVEGQLEKELEMV